MENEQTQDRNSIWDKGTEIEECLFEQWLFVELHLDEIVDYSCQIAYGEYGVVPDESFASVMYGHIHSVKFAKSDADQDCHSCQQSKKTDEDSASDVVHQVQSLNAKSAAQVDKDYKTSRTQSSSNQIGDSDLEPGWWLCLIFVLQGRLFYLTKNEE